MPTFAYRTVPARGRRLSCKTWFPHGDQDVLGIVREPRGVEGPGGNVLDGLVQECDEGDEKADACDRPPISYQRLPRQPAATSGAATPGFLGHFPFTHWGFGAPPLGAIPTVVREYLIYVAVRSLLFGLLAWEF